ncbi:MULTISPECIES: ATP-dependent helicase [Mycobacterium]|uniref:ATP-dependent helicase n=1 Tax=Mycobacterium TaxID=1763 RepID=UPI00025D5514|nr:MULTISPECIES: ATP-dependent DNA helicase [Mycobacterium]AFJ34987.1 DNA/RNA helicase [Mycobacterium sp. MOTT36Y]ASX00235.1 DNA helicase [Mycobacterium intracellulare subsp. chimaera]PBA63053.1 DNA helicase [Mycobacterium intracellulare subsp. chimaera]
MTVYTDSQREAIDCLDRPLQIIACAGSGKTQVISRRIANILAQADTDPRNIVAFTFTERAAAELKDRVLRVVAEQHGDITGMAEMYIGTMHGYCLDLLQRLVPETFKFSVLTEITARLLVDRNSRKSGLTTCPTSSAKVPTLRRYVNSKLFLQAMSILREDVIAEELVPQGVWESHASYLKLLYAHAQFDFTELINLVVQLLEADPSQEEEARVVQAHIQDDVRYVVVDEYQDVNALQERLITGLVQFGANLCVVGDDDQTIYQWRGSQVSNIISFADRHANVKQVTLADNFRSSKGVVELGRSVAERIPDSERLTKAMVSADNQTWERGDLLALTFDDVAGEAAWICDRIEALRGVPFRDYPESADRGLSWSDFAVLYRSVAKDADELVAELQRRGIPYVVKGLNRLFDSVEIKAVVGIFRAMVGELSEDDLRLLWTDANLLPEPDRWRSAFDVLEKGRDFGRGERWGVYNIQRVYLDFLQELRLREETVPGAAGRGELVFYQLGKFSQVISDFEQIYFNTAPEEKYASFVKWLEYQAPDYYAESDADIGYATPDAVTLSTVHQAKGMQWPVVFVPCMRRNRFPSKRQGGLSVFHVIPDEAIVDADRYRGTVEDETRLFYVAVTRAQKYLVVTFSPGPNQLYRNRSELFDHCADQTWVSTRPSATPLPVRIKPRALHEIPQVTFSFSELKYLFECPYSFKLRFLYGFNPPLHEALGYGKGLHDALSEVHKKAVSGKIVDASAAKDLVSRHLHTPFAYPELRMALEKAAVEAIERYFAVHGDEIRRTVHSEKQIQVHIAPGITVDGRIDLIRRLDTDELSIVDFKSTDRAQAEEVTRDQLHVYAVGYEELSGQNADLIEVLNLDEQGKSTREEVEQSLLGEVKARIKEAGESLRSNQLNRLGSWCSTCASCDLAGLCRDRP